MSSPRHIDCLLLILMFSTAFGTPAAWSQTNSEAIDAVKPPTPGQEQERRELMIGAWLGESKTKDGRIQKWLVKRSADGTYQIHFRRYEKKGKVTDHLEAGHWGISGDIYFSTVRAIYRGGAMQPTDPADPYIYDAYTVVELTSKTFTYQHRSTGNRFSVERVADDYELPKESPS